MANFESESGAALQYFLVAHEDRVIIKAMPVDEVVSQKKLGTKFLSGPFDSQQMADTALDDYLGDVRAE